MSKSASNGKRKPALEAARDIDQDPSTVDRLVRHLLTLGLDGVGPVDSAAEVAATALAKAGDREKAVRRVARRALVGGAAGGFVTGVGGFVTLPVAIPANVLEFYLQATRMVGAIATLRGYDLRDQHVRTAVLLALVGADADKVLKRAGLATGGTGTLATLALQKLPPEALLVVNKAIGFRIVRGFGEKAFARLGRAVPVVGGVVGGGFDGWMMKRIADHAMREFPAV